MNNIIELIKNANTIAILAHENEDADAAGSSFAIRYALMQMGKEATCYFSDKLEKHLNFMEKNYTIFDETAVLKVDLCLCLDCGDIKRIGNRVAIFNNAKATASIDHHVTNTNFADANYVDDKAAATGEILYSLFEKLEITFTKEIAENLYTAISADTGSFKYRNVRPNTLEIAAKLISTGIDFPEIARLLYDSEPRNVMRFKAEIMSNVEEYAGGALTIVTAKDELLKKYDISERDTGDIVNIARLVDTCKVAVSIRDAVDKIKISFRSNCEVDVSKIAMQFGGGGHDKAAGATQIGKSIDEVKQEVIKILEEVLNG